MKRFRIILAAALAVICCSAFAAAPAVNAGTWVNLKGQTIQPGHFGTWVSITDTNGFNVTDGKKPTIHFDFYENGNKVDFGLLKNSNRTFYSFYAAPVSGSSISASRTINSGSGLYKAYLINNNATVAVKNKASSYIIF